MTYLADQYKGGIDPLQNHSSSAIPIETRAGRYAGRISKYAGDGRPVIEQDSIGDVRNAIRWEPASRPIGIWSHAVPVVGGSPVTHGGGSFSDPDLVAKEGGAGGVGAGGGGGAPNDGRNWKKIGGEWFYYDGHTGTWRSPPYTVKPPPFGLDKPGGTYITFPEGRQRDPGFGLNAPGGVFITYPGLAGRGNGVSVSVGGGSAGPAGDKGSGGSVGGSGPIGAVGPPVVTGRGGGVIVANPIRGEYAPDRTLAPGSVSLPPGAPSIAGGSVGLVVGGTEHRYQAPVYLHGDPRLVSVNEGPDPQASSVVLDTDSQGRLDAGLSAPLHSAWRVVAPIETRTATAARGTLAWQFARGERDGVAGYGAIVDTSVRGGRTRVITPTSGGVGSGGTGSDASAPAVGAGNNVGVGYRAGKPYEFIRGVSGVASPNLTAGVPSPRMGGAASPASDPRSSKVDTTPALTIGLMSARVGGPIEVGHGQHDHHRLGRSGERYVNAAHIATKALFFSNPLFDGPVNFQDHIYPKVSRFPMKARSHIMYDWAQTHGIPGKAGISGKWDIWTEVPTFEEGGGSPPPEPPTTPTDPPTPPSQPPTTPGDTTLPPVRRGPPPVTPGDRALPPSPFPPAGATPPSDPMPGTNIPGVSVRGRGSAVGPQSDPSGYKFPSPTVRWPFVQATVKDGVKTRGTDPLVVAPGVAAYTATVWKPQDLSPGTVDLRSTTSVSAEEIARQSARRPVTLRAEAFGGRVGSVFSTTQGSKASRYVGGTGPGGVVYLPPEWDLSDIARTSFQPTASAAYVGHAPGVYTAWGQPKTDNGGWKSGVRVGATTAGAVTFESMDSSGAASTALGIDATGGVSIGKKFSLAGVVSPAQITANQNDYNPASLSTAAILRINSDAARNITGLAGGADDRMLIVENVGSFPITLKNADTGSSAANRFAFAGDMTLGADDTTWLTYDNTSARWRILGRAAHGIIDHVDSTTTINTTATETSAWSKSIPRMAAGDRMRIRLWATYINDTGVGRTLILRVKFGSTTVHETLPFTINTSAVRRVLKVEFDFAAYGATNAQRLGGTIGFGAATAPTTGTGSGGTSIPWDILGSSSEDTTSAKTLDVTIQHSISDVNLEWRTEHGYVEFLPVG